MSASEAVPAGAYHNIPLELRMLRQWVCWRYEDVGGRRTKVPYTPNGHYKASINNSATWGCFDEACATALGPVMDGIGFVLTEHDPYTGIDIDDKLENPASEEERAMHVRILEAFQSYTERSVGGRGYHIIIRGKIIGGRDRGHVGVYSTQRYLTFSGDVVRNAPIAECQELLNQLIAGMPAAEQHAEDLWEEEAILTDRELFEMAMGAANGGKYDELCKGNWQAMGYPSQSEADLALVSMLAFYTRSNEQVRRLFRMTALGKRDKAVRNNTYLDRMLKLVRGGQATPTDFEQARRNAAALALPVPGPSLALAGGAATLLPASLPVPSAGMPMPLQAAAYPPGLIGELAQYFYETAIRPTYEMAIAAAIGITAGVAGRAYNISNTGLNQYLLLIAPTGTGKEGMSTGIGNLLTAVRSRVPMVDDFVGPSQFASGQGLVRVLDSKPCFVSILGEFGLQLQALSDPKANGTNVMLRKVILDLYGKSGWEQVLRSTAYSDSEKNTKNVHAPALTILGESTPETFFDKLNVGDIADGLIPRFHIIEYKGKRPKKNRAPGREPPPELIGKFANLAAAAITASGSAAIKVESDAEASKLLDAFDEECDAHIDGNANAGEKQLWNRAHLKALKLAGLLAVGINPHKPVVTADLAQWAIAESRAATEAVAHRFKSGDVGAGEPKQQHEIRRIIAEYFAASEESLVVYRCKPELQREGIVPYLYLTMRLARLQCFYDDKRGATGAIRNAIELLVQTEVLGQVSQAEAKRFGVKQALYVVGPNW